MSGSMGRLLKSEPLVSKMAIAAKYVVLPGAMLASLIYSPPDYVLRQSSKNDKSS